MKIKLQNCEICSTKHELITGSNNISNGKHEVLFAFVINTERNK